MPETNARIKVCHDTAANFKTNNPTLLVGEWALETDTKKMKIGDGATAYNALPYSTAEDSDEWRKPDDWIDIRSGALTNSIYLLVAHSAPTESEGTYTVSTYPQFKVKAYVDNSGTYDVYVDGLKAATTNSAAVTTLDWGALYTVGTIVGGFDVTHPSSLTTHVVRITPTVNTNTITSITLDSSISEYGLLWLHFNITNSIGLYQFSGSYSNSYSCKLLEAVTSNNDELKIKTGITFKNANSLSHLPLLIGNNDNIQSPRGFLQANKLKKIRIKDMVLYGNQMVSNSAIEIIETNNAYIRNENNCLVSPNLKKLPPLTFSGSNASSFITAGSSLAPVLIDARDATAVHGLGIKGVSQDNPATGIKGVLVSNEGFFDGDSAPQLDVSYTGLSRAALVNLFKSMPYNVGYEVVGSPTIVDGIASGFSTTDYVKMPIYTSGTDIFIKTAFVRTEDDTNVRIITNNISAEKMIAINYASNHLKGSVTINNTRYQVDSSATIVAGTKYYTEVERVGTKLKIRVSTDNNTWVTDEIDVPEGVLDIQGSEVRIGANPGMATVFWKGSVDLNNTYIKINGVPWFTGKAAMTKTCSVVGCTGTADLTQEDKNIVLNKGWELTVA